MSKKSSSPAKPLILAISCLATALGIVAIFLPFADFIKGTAMILGFETHTYFTGFSLIFAEQTLVGCLVTWILVLSGSVITLLAFLLGLLSKKSKGSSLLLLLGSLCLIVGGVMYFFFIPMAGFESAGDSTLGVVYSLEISAILAGIFATAGGLIGGCASAYAILKH